MKVACLLMTNVLVLEMLVMLLTIMEEKMSNRGNTQEDEGTTISHVIIYFP